MIKRVLIGYLFPALLLFGASACRDKKLVTPETRVEGMTEKAEDVVFGDASAPQTIFMYASYSCNYCRFFFTRTYPELKKNYLDRGTVKLVVKWIDPSEQPEMLNALQAASCIGRYGIYDKYHELLLANPGVVFTPAFNDLLDDIMEKNQQIAECVLHNDNYSYLRGNLAEFRAAGLSGTPAFVLNGNAYVGFRSFRTFQKIIQNEFK